MTRLLALALALGAAGCEETDAPAGDGAGGAEAAADAAPASDAAPAPDGPCVDEATVRARVLATDCATAGCHSAAKAEADLDLETPGIAARLEGVASIHPDCADRSLLVPGDAAASFLVLKTLGLHGGCGDEMPPGGDLRPDQRRCLAEWVTALGED